MNDDAFLAFILNSTPRYEIETLEKIVEGLNHNIASRRWGTPSGLLVGSNVEATLFGTSFRDMELSSVTKVGVSRARITAYENGSSLA